MNKKPKFVAVEKIVITQIDRKKSGIANFKNIVILSDKINELIEVLNKINEK